MNHPALVSRSWNGTPISRRTTDGYVNATSMCKANGKRWKDYRESDRCQLNLDALESVAGISVHALVESRSGGAGGGGTWVHPQVAVDPARWISAPFAVWKDGWFLESVQLAQPAPVETTAAHRLREAEVIALVERSIVVFERLGGLDERDQLLFKDIVRSNVLTASSGLGHDGRSLRCSGDEPGNPSPAAAAPRAGGHSSGTSRTWRPRSRAGAGAICSTERHKSGVESRLYRWP